MDISKHNAANNPFVSFTALFNEWCANWDYVRSRRLAKNCLGLHPPQIAGSTYEIVEGKDSDIVNIYFNGQLRISYQAKRR